MDLELSLVPVSASDLIFSHEELKDFLEQIRIRTRHFIEIQCGCTSRRYGDTVGFLRVCDDGTIEAICHCSEECKKVFNSPMEFAKHAGKSTNVQNWRTKIWVMNDKGERVKLAKTCLLKFYNGDQYRRPRQKAAHRAEFLRCSRCNKIRRFERHSKEACRFYHDAMAREDRTCSDMIPGRWTCEDREERISSRIRTGCRRNIRCKGCLNCVCFGCTMCMFEDCACRVCVDFYVNAPR